MKAVFLAALACVLLFAPRACDTAAARPPLTVVFMGVGQGDATYIEAPNGNQLLIDGGPGSGILDPLSALVPFGDRSLNTVLLMGPTADHSAGLTDVLRQYSVGAIVEPGGGSAVPAYGTFEQTAFDLHVPRIFARKGMKIMLDAKDGVEFDIMYPDSDATASSGIMGQLVYGKTRILFAGSASKKTESSLLAENSSALLKSQILMLSKGSQALHIGDVLVSAVAPKEIVIVGGDQGQYTTHEQETLDTLEHPGITTVRTDTGNRGFVSNGLSFTPMK